MPKTPLRDIKMGDVIAGRYEVRGAVGRGGMGRIYRVYDRILGEELALKTLLPDHVEDKVVLERFFNEARIARSLSHPNVVRVHDIGQADGTIYISMELLKGKSLRQMLDQLQPGQRLPIAGILRMFDALCAALDYAHHFTVHRDIKPENVMILTDGSVKLMDFGISKLKSNPNLTSASIVMGTPHYMAPEQLRNTSAVDARADVYSVGVMLYEVITGDRPTGLAKPASKIRGEVPAALDPIIEKCCQLDPNKRYQTAGELRAALREVRIDIEQKSHSGEHSASSSEPPRASGGGTMKYVAAGLAFLAILAIATGALRTAEKRRKELLAAAPSGLATLPHPLSNADPASRQFAALAGRIDSLRTAAGDAQLDYSEAQQAGVIDDILARGDELWAAARARAGSDPASALELGWDAVGCFVAVAHWPEHRVFIPPAATGQPRAEGFFIDDQPVTAGEFESFSAANNWEWPIGVVLNFADAPMTGAAYLDAAAYLASGAPPRRLPTADELERALDRAIERGTARRFGSSDADPAELESEEDAGDPDAPRPTRTAFEFFYVPDEAYGVGTWLEWSSSTDNLDSTATPMFGDDVITPGARWTQSDQLIVVTPQTSRYEWSNEWLGFRGKIDLPRTMRDLERFTVGSM